MRARTRTRGSRPAWPTRRPPRSRSRTLTAPGDRSTAAGGPGRGHHRPWTTSATLAARLQPEDLAALGARFGDHLRPPAPCPTTSAAAATAGAGGAVTRPRPASAQANAHPAACIASSCAIRPIDAAARTTRFSHRGKRNGSWYNIRKAGVRARGYIRGIDRVLGTLRTRAVLLLGSEGPRSGHEDLLRPRRAGDAGRSARSEDPAEKVAARAEQEAIRGVYERAEALAYTLDRACHLLLEGHLLAAGYHCPGYRAWRRRRVADRSQPGPSPSPVG